MIDHIGFAPAPPLLVPEVASGAAAELDELRAACDEMLTKILAESTHLILLTTPTAHALGEWLIARSTWPGPVDIVTVATSAEPAPVDGQLREIAASHRSSAVLVMGDGSACRTEKSPGYLDPRAIDFDDAIATAIANVDANALADMDQQLAAELLVEGRLTWPTVAALVGADTREWAGDLMYQSDPYGVNYLVAAWRVTSSKAS